MSLVKTSIVVLLLVVGATALQCWVGTARSVRRHKHFDSCVSTFIHEKGTFDGNTEPSPDRAAALDTKNKAACYMEAIGGSNLKYTCTCFTDMCNIPLPFSDFLVRNFDQGTF